MDNNEALIEKIDSFRYTHKALIDKRRKRIIYWFGKEKEIRVPQDVRIVGFDDTRLAALMQPQLTTIHQPIKEMATEAVTLALNAVEGRVIAKRTLLPVTLVERETT